MRSHVSLRMSSSWLVSVRILHSDDDRSGTTQLSSQGLYTWFIKERKFRPAQWKIE